MPIKIRKHLIECLVYIDLNMVRAGAVKHPSDWPHSGYKEIQELRRRYVIIDHDRLLDLAGAPSLAGLQRDHQDWVSSKLAAGPLSREERWTTAEPDSSA